MKGIAALVVLSLLAAGCGGGSASVSTETALPAQSFAFKVPDGPLRFMVRSSSETEFRGTGVTSSLSFDWIAQDWQQEEGGVSAEVVFEKIKGARRRGSSISMEPVKEVERLEGFRWRFLRDDGGFAAITEPARDPEFMAVFDQLEMGLQPLGLTAPDAAIAVGGSWPLDTDADAVGRLSGAIKSQRMNATYKGDETHAGVRCAKIEFKGQIDLDGELGSGEARASVNGSVKIDGTGFYDPARGFLLNAAMKIKTSIKQRSLDEKGKPSGPEFGFIQTASVTVSLAGD